jgi:branched-chain amino acid transport system ATP-binding protein
MLRVENLHTSYGQLEVLHGVDIDVPEGDLAILMGPNGHGKSTLLKTICGLLRLTKGDIHYKGNDIGNWPSEKIVGAGLVYIAEDRHLFPDMTVFENLEMGAYLKSARENEKHNLQFTYSLFPELEAKKNQPASTLSGGQARMLTIGRGILSDAQFLCIDEPTIGLSPLLRQKVNSAILEINRQGKTILLVEQNRSELFDMASRIYFMEEGKIVFNGEKEGALNHDSLKALFLGMNS